MNAKRPADGAQRARRVKSRFFWPLLVSIVTSAGLLAVILGFDSSDDGVENTVGWDLVSACLALIGLGYAWWDVDHPSAKWFARWRGAFLLALGTLMAIASAFGEAEGSARVLVVAGLLVCVGIVGAALEIGERRLQARYR